MTYQGPPPPPPSYPPPAAGPPPPGRPRTLRTVLIVLAVVGVLCCGVATAGGVWLFRTVQDVTAPPREATHAYLGAVQAGDYDRAYDRLCGSVQATYPRQEFVWVSQQRRQLVDYRLTGVHVSNRNGRVSAAVDARLTFADGSTGSYEFSLVREGDDWRVCGQPFLPNP